MKPKITHRHKKHIQYPAHWFSLPHLGYLKGVVGSFCLELRDYLKASGFTGNSYRVLYETIEAIILSGRLSWQVPLK
ncbi:MAG: hypothetical protein H7249_16625 [Chitinophagaceae bacterium]|nr:hypothetical protein [Oligoflexus sp.]